MRFQDKSALVTGGSRGIGLAVATQLARKGCDVHLIARNPKTLGGAVEAIRRETGRDASGTAADLGEESGLEKVFEWISGRKSAINFLVNNAGIVRDNLVLRMKPDQWDEVLRVNLTATFRITRAVLPGMVKARFGRVVNVASVVALGGNPGQANYVAAKAGMIGFTKSLAREVGSRNITVNAVAPGFIETDMTRELAEGNRKEFEGRIPLGRFGKPGDVAAAVCFLLSDAGDYITGEVLNISGGLYM